MKDHPRGVIDPFLQVNIADNILSEVFQITKQLKIKAFLAFGLCLGFFRDGGYIKGDNDLDIGVICNKEERIALINSLEKNDFIYGRTFSHPYNNTHFFKNRILVDIYWRKSDKFYSNLDSVQYKSKIYPIPSPIEEYLSACYTNWQIKEDEMTRYYG